MSSATGRNHAAYKRARAEFQTGRYPCTLGYPGCTGIGTTPDHDPPLTAFPTPRDWHGTLRPACLNCQRRQGNALRNQINHTRWTW